MSFVAGAAGGWQPATIATSHFVMVRSMNPAPTTTVVWADAELFVSLPSGMLLSGSTSAWFVKTPGAVPENSLTSIVRDASRRGSWRRCS